MHRANHRADRAEGDIVLGEARYPYETDLISINGVNLHVWIGDATPTPDFLETLAAIGRRDRDVVRCSYCTGHPTGYYSHNDMHASPSRSGDASAGRPKA